MTAPYHKSDRPPITLEIGKGVRYYNVEWYAEQLGLSRIQMLRFVKQLGVPVIRIGTTRWILNSSFQIAMYSIGMLGKKDFLGPGYLADKGHPHEIKDSETSLDLKDTLDNLPKIISCILFGARISGLVVDRKSLSVIKDNFVKLKLVVSSTQSAYEKAAMAWSEAKEVTEPIDPQILNDIHDEPPGGSKEEDPKESEEIGRDNYPDAPTESIGGLDKSHRRPILQPELARESIRAKWIRYRGGSRNFSPRVPGVRLSRRLEHGDENPGGNPPSPERHDRGSGLPREDSGRIF